MTLSVRCEGLFVGWPGNVLVKDFDIDETFDGLNYALPIIGRTGRGKSTLLYALSGMAQPIRGHVSWLFPADEKPTMWSLDDRSFKAVNALRRQKFGFLLQDAGMIPCFTVEENLRHALRLRGVNGNPDRQIEKAVRTMLIEGETPGDFLGRYPSKLSGGQRQRMALAAAIAHDPVVLFADEPTASLDDKSGLEVLGRIRRWLDEAKGHRAFVFVTHRVETLYEGIGARRALVLEMQNLGTDQKIVRTWQKVEGSPGGVARRGEAPN